MLLVAIGLAFTLRAAAPPVDGLLLIPGVFVLAVGIIGSIAHPVQRHRAASELTTLERLVQESR